MKTSTSERWNGMLYYPNRKSRPILSEKGKHEVWSFRSLEDFEKCLKNTDEVVQVIRLVHVRETIETEELDIGKYNV